MAGNSLAFRQASYLLKFDTYKEVVHLLRIRLTRRGAKKSPHYRVVIAEKSSPRDGRFVEIVGHYNPAREPAVLHLDLERVQYWLEKGAQPTQTVRTLIRRAQDQSQAADEQDLIAQEAEAVE